MKKILILVLLFTLYTSTALAVDSTPSADIKAKLEDLKKEIASKAAVFKQQINQKLKDKAYIGKIKTKSPTALTLATKNGPKIVNVNQDSILPKKKLAEEDYLAALGDVDEVGVLTAKKIILLPMSNDQNPKTYLWGQVVAISDKLVTIKDRNLKSIAVSIPNSAKVNTGDFIILTGTVGKNDIFKADFVHVILQGGILKPKKIATPSAKEATKSNRSR